MFKRSIRLLDQLQKLARASFKFLILSKSSPVNKVPAMAIDQSRPKRKRRERGQRVLDLDLGQASWDLGHLDHAWPLKAAKISFLKPLHLDVPSAP